MKIIVDEKSLRISIDRIIICNCTISCWKHNCIMGWHWASALAPSVQKVNAADSGRPENDPATGLVCKEFQEFQAVCEGCAVDNGQFFSKRLRCSREPFLAKTKESATCWLFPPPMCTRSDYLLRKNNLSPIIMCRVEPVPHTAVVMASWILEYVKYMREFYE